ncbi:MAG: transcriptional regulator [Sphingobacteriales bacterium]|nr:MAG: transcriptional regulator [Sphingobacteriales bacterium]
MSRPSKTKPAIPSALQNFDLLPASAHVRVDVVCGLFAQSPATTWRRARLDPNFPKPRKFGPQHTAWNVGELRSYLFGRAVA